MSRYRVKGYILLFLTALLPAGCVTVGPDYAPPEISMPKGWNAKSEGGLSGEGMDAKALALWWSSLNDPVLTGFIERAVDNNHDLQVAKARVRESRARLGISSSERFPTVDASGSARISRGSEETGTGDERKLYAAGFDAAWELDLFGGIKRSVEAAHADLQASQESLSEVLVSLAAEVALNYVDVRTLQARLSIAEANLNAQEETHRLAKAMYDAELAPELDVEQANYNLENTRSQIPTLNIRLGEAMNRIAVLLGKGPGSVHNELSERGPIPAAQLEIAVGVPADILRQRPDVRRTERELAAQTARVGVAAAELYPKLTLTGSIGIEALSTDRLFLYDSRNYRTGPGLSWPVFHAGAIRKNVKVQSAKQEQALIEYEATVLKALEEVENAMSAYAGEQLRRKSLTEAARAARHAAELAQNLYFSGLSDFQGVLDVQRTLLSIEDKLAETEGNVTSGLIRIYKALGGGWKSPESAAGDNSSSQKEK